MTCPLCRCDPSAPAGDVTRLFVPEQPPSQNAFKGQQFHVYARLRRDWTKWLRAAAMVVGAGSVPDEQRMRLTVTRYLGPRNRYFDHGNLVGGCKPVVDAMRDLGLIADDTPDLLEAFYHQRKDPTREPGLELVLTELLPNQQEMQG